jgi:hypothetical protein
MGAHAYKKLPDAISIEDWEGMKTHRQAEEIRSHVPRGRVLTLAPICPLEAGLSIYPAFSTGPFAWRISPYVEPAKAARLGILSPATLEQALRAAPPSGVLVGFEGKGEVLLSKYARKNGYESRALADDHRLWVRRRE